MSGDVVMPHTQSFGNAINDALLDTNNSVLKTQYMGAGAVLGAFAGQVVGWGIGAVTGNPVLGATAATVGRWVGGGVGWYASSVSYEVTHSDWYRGVVSPEQDNNTHDNIQQYNGFGVSGNTVHFDWTVNQMDVKAWFDSSDQSKCIRIDAIGTDRAELLAGCNVRNVFDGGAGNDKLYGAGGNDILKANKGNDYIQDGTGADTMVGGAGADRFDFVSDIYRDTVNDFSIGQGDKTVDFGQVRSFSQLYDAFGKASVLMVANAVGDKVYIDGAPWEHGGWTLAEIQQDQHAWGIY